MKSPSSLLDTATSAEFSIKFWLSIGTALALMLGIAVATAYPKDPPKISQALKPALMKPQTHSAMAQDAQPDSLPDAPLPVDLYRFALNALLVPLMDDSHPPRWNDAALDHVCEPGTNVLIDGEPMVTGRPIPAKPFTVRWNMNRCSPLGLESVALSGQVELLVFQTDNGLGAIVTPGGLRVDSHLGSGWLQGPFAAETSLAAPAAKASERTRHAS